MRIKRLLVFVLLTLVGHVAHAKTWICRGIDKDGRRLTIRGGYGTDGELSYWADGALTVDLDGETRTFGEGDWRMSADNASVGIRGETANGSRISINHYERFRNEDEIRLVLKPSDAGGAYSTLVKNGDCRL